MPSPSSVAKRPCGTAITPSPAARATWRGWTTAKCSMRCRGSRRGYCLQRPLVRVEHHVDGQVADRVRGDLPAGAVRGDDRGLQLGRVGLQVAAALPAPCPVAVVRVVQGGGPPDQGSVGEDLHRAEPEPVVAEAGLDAQVQPGHQAVAGVRAEGVQDLAGRHQLDPDPEPALVPGRLVGGELGRAVRDPAAADAGLGAAGDAFLQVLRGGQADGLGQLGQRVRVDQAADQELGPFLEQAGGTSAGVGGDPAAGQLGAGLLQAEIGQDQAVHHAHVPGGMPQPDPPPRRGPVEGVPVRVGAELVLVVAGPDHPVPRRRRLRPAGNRRVQLVEAAGRGRAQVDFGQGHAEPDHVVVRVVEPGQHRRAAQVDHPAAPAGPASRASIRPPAMATAEARGRARSVHGQHVGVDQRQVGHGATAGSRCIATGFHNRAHLA